MSPLRRIITLGLLLSAASCSGLDESYLSADGSRLVADLPPAPYRIAIGSIEDGGFLGQRSGYGIHASTADVRRMIVDGLHAVRAASDIVETSNPAEADLSLSFRVHGNPRVTKKDSNVLLPWVAYFLTYVSLFALEEVTYTSSLPLEVTVREGDTVVHTFEVDSGEVGLTYYERKGVNLGSILLSFLFVPQAFASNSEAVSEVVTREACRQLAARIAQNLKEELPKRQRKTVFLNGLENGSWIGSPNPTLNVEIDADELIESAAVIVAGKTFTVSLDPEQYNVLTERYGARFTRQVDGIRPGLNLIRISFRANGKLYGRTFTLRHS